LKLNDEGIGRFESVILKPQVVLVDSSQINEATQLHTQAGKLCFIANSVNFDINYDIKTV
jgi:organic hydroperoxide reductase OsmC/OhrA